MKRIISIITALSILLVYSSCGAQSSKSQDVRKVTLQAPKGKAIAAFALGCFWCSANIFDSVAGIDSAVSGYAGGTEKNPTYEKVSSETTGHAETVLVYYDPKKISYSELTKVFFASHDPTTLNQQGPDQGTSYRSILFYRTPAEKALAQQAIRNASLSGKFLKPIVTELKPLTSFYRAEAYHQDYEKKNPNNPYIRAVSKPRFEEFKKTYKGKLKEKDQ
jgi:peptide-methionine (S)-S-oxide reductase